MNLIENKEHCGSFWREKWEGRNDLIRIWKIREIVKNFVLHRNYYKWVSTTVFSRESPSFRESCFMYWKQNTPTSQGSNLNLQRKGDTTAVIISCGPRRRALQSPSASHTLARTVLCPHEGGSLCKQHLEDSLLQLSLPGSAGSLHQDSEQHCVHSRLSAQRGCPRLQQMAFVRNIT